MPDAAALRLYARAHQAMTYCAGTASVSVLLVLALHTTVGLDSWNGQAVTPAAATVTAGYGILAAGTWGLRSGSDRGLYTRHSARVRAWHAPVVTLASVLACMLTTFGGTGELNLAVAYGRAAILWCGVGFLTSVLCRPSLAWSGPVALAVVLSYAGFHVSGEPRSWNVPLQPAGDLASWCVTATVAGIAFHLAGRLV